MQKSYRSSPAVPLRYVSMVGIGKSLTSSLRRWEQVPGKSKVMVRQCFTVIFCMFRAAAAKCSGKGNRLVIHAEAALHRKPHGHAGKALALRETGDAFSPQRRPNTPPPQPSMAQHRESMCVPFPGTSIFPEHGKALRRLSPPHMGGLSKRILHSLSLASSFLYRFCIRPVFAWARILRPLKGIPEYFRYPAIGFSQAGSIKFHRGPQSAACPSASRNPARQSSFSRKIFSKRGAEDSGFFRGILASLFQRRYGITPPPGGERNFVAVLVFIYHAPPFLPSRSPKFCRGLHVLFVSGHL